MEELNAAATCATTENNSVICGLNASLSLVFIVLVLVLSFCFIVLSASCKRNDLYQNGVSIRFAVRLGIMGPGFQSLMKITAESTRRRLYTGMRRFVFFGREIWMAGHPAMCKHIFTPAHHRLFKKIEKDELANLMFQGGGEPNLASKLLTVVRTSPTTCVTSHPASSDFMQCFTLVMTSAGNMPVKFGAHSL
jgi:hypothetical protein